VDGQREPDPRTGADYRVDKPMQQAKAIRATCLDCTETSADVRRCHHRDCPLWRWRMGNPAKSGISETENAGWLFDMDQEDGHAGNDPVERFSDIESRTGGH
jgi:hypothetical protein